MEGKREEFEELATRLYDAALEGDVSTLLELLELDATILDRCRIERLGRFTQSPLHIAADLGHLNFVQEILRRKPNMCLALDEYGRNPVHIAAIEGQVDVLRELLEAKPQAAYEWTRTGETVLHLCVKYDQLEALEYLVDVVDNTELLNAKDSIGNTALHLAAIARNLEMLQFLVKDERIEKDVMNVNGYTAMDICRKNGKYGIDKEIQECLEGAKALEGKEVKKQGETRRTWSENQYEGLMVVASLISTMAYQATTSPPGGFWQDTRAFNTYNGSLAAQTFDDYTTYYGYSILQTIPGQPVISYNFRDEYNTYTYSSMIAFAASLSVILLVISGFRQSPSIAVLLTIIMWIALSAISVTFWVGLNLTAPNYVPWGMDSYDNAGDDNLKHSVYANLHWSFNAWITLLACILLGHVLRVIKNSRLGRRFIRKLQYGCPAWLTASCKPDVHGYMP